MARRASEEPTERELDLLKILWQIGPAELGQVVAELRKSQEVATTTVATLLGVMLKKRLVKRASGEKGYRWSVRVTQESTSRRAVDRLVDRLFDGSAKALVCNLLDSGSLSETDRQEILALLQQKHPPRSSGRESSP